MLYNYIWIIVILVIFYTVFILLITMNNEWTAEPLNTTAILIHTFDGYRRYWGGFFYFYNKYYPVLYWPTYFANENMDLDTFNDTTRFIQIKTGTGEWGYRLLQALKQIPEEYILYIQEDMWLTSPLDQDYLYRAERTMKKHNLVHLKLQQNCTHKILEESEVNNSLWYIISHQPALWLKTFLISTLTADMSPFQHETQTNVYLHQHPEIVKKCKCNQDFEYITFPYEDVSRKGTLRPIGRKMIQRAGLTFKAAEDEVFFRGQ